MKAVDDVHVVQAEVAHHSFAAEAAGRMAVGEPEDIGLGADAAVDDSRLAAAGTGRVVVGIDPEVDSGLGEEGIGLAEGIGLEEDTGLEEGIGLGEEDTVRSLEAGEAL